MMAFQLFELKTLVSIFDEPRSQLPATSFASAGRDDLLREKASSNLRITRCAFQQIDQMSVSVLVRSDHFLTLLLEEVGTEPKRKSVQWFLAAGKAVTSICLIHSSMWALLVTDDASLYILPVLPLIDPEIRCSTASAGYPTDDVTFIIMKKQKHTKPTSVTCWQSTYSRGDMALVGTEEGEVVFVDLETRLEVFRVKIGDAIVKLDVVNHGKSLTYLLISTASNNQFGLLLEQTNSRAESLSNSMEVTAKSLEFTLVRRAETVVSILGPEATDPMFRPLRFDQFMRTVQLSKQVVKGNPFIVAHCLSSNILKVYDSSLDSWLPIFVYGIPISTDGVLLTDSFIFAVSRVKKQRLTSITALSSLLSETSKNDQSSSDAKLQTIMLPIGEEIVGIYRQVHPDGSKSGSDGERNSSVHPEDGSDAAAVGDEMFVEGCIIFTKRAVYQIKPRVKFVDLFLDLIAEGSVKKAELLGMTLDLNMSSLYLRAAEEKLARTQLQEANKLFRLSRGSTVTWASLLSKYGYMKEAVSVIEGALGKQGEVSSADCRKLADIAIKSLVYLHLKDSSDQRSNLLHLDTFLADNLDYDEHAAISLLADFELWDSMLEMAKMRGYLIVAMETLLENWPDPLDAVLLKKLETKAFLGAFVSAADGAFIDVLPKPEVIRLIVSKPELLFRHTSVVQDNIPEMTVHQLLQVAALLDPTKPLVRQLFETSKKRQRSLSLSSVVSLDSFYGFHSRQETVPLPEASTLVQVFVSVLVELLRRRSQDGYDSSVEPSLAEIDEDYCDGTEEERGVSSDADTRRNLISCGQHHTCLISSGELYTWGNATSGRLGHGSIIPVEGCSPPLRVETLHMHHQLVLSVSCGSKHTLALTSMGRVYAWGNSAYGQVGCGDRKTRTHPSVVEELQGKGCVEISCGNYHCLARTQNSRVWSWGWGVHGQLGHGDTENQLAPKVVGALLGKDIVQIGAGACHSGVLGSDGKAWMFGSGFFGQLGMKGVRKSSVPLLLSSLAMPVKILVCGYYHCLALTDTDPQRLYSWGKSPMEVKNNMQISRKLKAHLKKTKNACPVDPSPKSLELYSKPVLVPTEHIQTPIKKILASCTHNLLLTSFGNLYAWGRNDMDQLGNPTSHKKQIDTPVPVMAGQTFADVGAGMNFSAAVSHYGMVYTWGSAEGDQLGYSLQQHASLMPSTTLLSVSSPRAVPTVPLITIPAELLQSYEEDLDNIPPELDTDVLPKANTSTTVMDKLLTVLPTPSLAMPMEDTDQLAYNCVSLLAVLEHLSEYYQLSEVVGQCERSGLWSLVTEIHVMNGDFDQALLATLKEVQCQEKTLSVEQVVPCLHKFFKMLSQKISHASRDEQHRSLQLILIEVFRVWHEHGFPFAGMESLLQGHLGLLAYPLSLLLFCSKSSIVISSGSPFLKEVQASLSIQFCLQVTSAAMRTIEEDNFSGTSSDHLSLDTEVSNSGLYEPPPDIPRSAKSGTVELTAEFIQANSWFGKEGLVISAEELSRGTISQGSLEAPHAMGSKKIVAFTCGHSFESETFYREELPKISKKFMSYTKKPTESCNILTGLYDGGVGIIAAACPQCSLEPLVI